MYYFFLWTNTLKEIPEYKVKYYLEKMRKVFGTKTQLFAKYKRLKKMKMKSKILVWIKLKIDWNNFTYSKFENELHVVLKNLVRTNLKKLEEEFRDLDEINSGKLTPEMLHKLLNRFNLMDYCILTLIQFTMVKTFF